MGRCLNSSNKNSTRTKDIFLLLYVFIGHLSYARIIQLNTEEGFNNACVNAVPGDTIEIVYGIYNNDSSIILCNSSNADQPILIRAKNIVQAGLTGNTYFELRQYQYKTIEGFLFTSTDATVIQLQACNNVRITRNIFRLNETSSLKWVIVGCIWNDLNAISHHKGLTITHLEINLKPVII